MAVRKNISDFENIFPLSKTLRFELRPMGDTLRLIEKNGIIEEDVLRAGSYKKMKETIDAYHRDYIDRCLSGLALPEKELADFYRMYTASADVKAGDDFRQNFDKIKAKLRKIVFDALKNGSEYKLLDKKELIQSLAVDFARENNLYYDAGFNNFTTYFSGYNTNRMNMYTDEEKSTAIPYRLINENLPKFIDNMQIFGTALCSEVKECLTELHGHLKEFLDVERAEDLFTLAYYPFVLTQPKIDAYNLVIGGRKEEGEKKKIQGLNEYINLYNQQHPDKKLPKLKKLYKQILAERTETSFVPHAFESAGEMLDSVGRFYSDLFGGDTSAAGSLAELMQKMDSFDAGGIYIKGASSSGPAFVSFKLFGDYSIMRSALEYYYRNVLHPGYESRYSGANENERVRLDKNLDKYIKKECFTLSELQSALDCYAASLDIPFENYTAGCIVSCFGSACGTLRDSVKRIYSRAESTLRSENREDLPQCKKDVLKALLDEVMSFMRLLKPFYTDPDFDKPKDERFYAEFTPLYERLAEISPLYDAVRNYVTKKPYSTEKIKLNFGCGYLLNGWAQDYENKGAFIVEQKDKYYLAVLNKNLSREEIESLENGISGNKARLIEYHFQKPDMKNNPRIFIRSKGDSFAPAVGKYNLPVYDILDIYDNGKFKTEYKKVSEVEFKSSLIKMIDYYKTGFQRHESYKDFVFRWKPSDEYNSIDEFYRDVTGDCYYLSKKAVSFDVLLDLVRENALYLFEIYSKDFSSYSRGRPNLHTLYWKAVFDDDHQPDPAFKLNGQAEIFYRRSSVGEDGLILHKSGIPIDPKNPSREKKSVFGYDLVKDRRYTVDKFMFHVPVTMNFKARGGMDLNREVRLFIRNNSDVNILGIDRGERHLIYISLIDRTGRVIYDENGLPVQYHLDTITGEYKTPDGSPVEFGTPYLELLKQKGGEREKARENWGTVENIKELKSGYLSQVVHHISRLVVRYNAVIVMEDLNDGFKNSRKKFEQQVYQKFESALTQKLGYLVFKDTDPDKPGGLHHALQLASPSIALKDLRYQNGILFYVDARNTSKIDPVTGFVDLLKPKYTSVRNVLDFWTKFRSIRFDAASGCFLFDFDYADFVIRVDRTKIKTKWTLMTYGGLRYSYNRTLNGNRGGYEKHDLTEEICRLFNENNIPYDSGADLVGRICAVGSAVFHQKLMRYLQILLAMRYSCADDNRDFILSPVADETGIPFCTEDARRVKDGGLPQDADANGAYNIARKGLLLLRQIDENDDDKAKLSVKYADWLAYAQNG